MDDMLLVRLYNVGLGDCIYLRVPDGAQQARHILIDCGNKFASSELLTAAIEDLKEQLRPNGGRLDLLVATHSHEDHIRGFDKQRFAGIRIDRIWLSVAMDPDHPQAEKVRELQEHNRKALAGLRESSRGALSELAASLMSLSKGEGLKALREDLPAANDIEPLYVHAGTRQQDLRVFTEKDNRLLVLAPMAHVDGFYLGKEFDRLDEYLGFCEVRGQPAEQAAPAQEKTIPQNISSADFERLKERLQSNALAFALEEGHLVNNTSVVLLLEWRGRRLLFTGDAEYKLAYEGKYREGKSNGSWNVMWEKQRKHLRQPLDFLKVGHHGSENATPWTTIKLGEGQGASRSQRPHPINDLLDALLPLPAEGESPSARAVVSTERSGYPTIPSPALMEELGKRVGNRKRYDEPRENGHFVAPDVPQPQRTDLEWQVAGDSARKWVDVVFTPATRARARTQRSRTSRRQ